LVKPYVKRGKNDAADAEALCEAMSRPTMRFVPIKTAEQQAALMLVSVRDRLIRNRTQLANAIRGYAAEFGLTAARGMAQLVPLLERIRVQPTSRENPWRLPDWRRAVEDEDPGSWVVSIWAPVRRMDRLNAERSFDSRQSQAGRHHTGRRRGVTKRPGRWSHCGDPAGTMRGKGVTLARRAFEAKVTKVGRRCAGQQDGAHRLEADGYRAKLSANATAAAAATGE
jgi:hypothetical protein